MTAYYNENDLFAARYLENLIDAGLIAPGVVDSRSIEDVTPNDLKGFTQCHFFAGIGIWSYALRLAGWPDNRPVWTGSCPCQPFSSAGEGAGFADERHLWPAFQWLIEQRRPAVVFGEQVASKAAEPWIDLVQADMEAMDYAFGCVPFPSAGVGTPHIRDRAYWVADTQCDRFDRGGDSGAARWDESADSCMPGERPSPVNGFWRDADWLLCQDEKWRPVEPGTFPLVDGAPARVGRLRTYGNAINAEAAKQFIKAYLACELL